MTSATAVPDRSLEQRFEALRRADLVRKKRARWKRSLKQEAQPCFALGRALLNPGDELVTMNVLAMLIACPGFGRVKANRLLTETGIAPTRTVGGLTERQRRELAGVVAKRGRR